MRLDFPAWLGVGSSRRIIEIEPEQRVQKVLHIVLVPDDEWGSVGATLL
jgi:hypothetical protein